MHQVSLVLKQLPAAPVGHQVVFLILIQAVFVKRVAQSESTMAKLVGKRMVEICK